MGVAGLWDLLRPAATTRSLTELAVVDGFQKNKNGLRGFRIGIDASIWFFHAEYGKEGENPVLRTLFFRCASLARSPFLPLFVFDGPKRPDIKRGKKINKTSHKLIPGMKKILDAFGFEWRTAPGEAEAELAYLNEIGILDGILSDDVDNFLFGAVTVIRNSSNNLSGNRANPTLNSAGKDDKNHTRVYHLHDIKYHPDIRLTRGGMILIGLMSGGDYEQSGLTRCGIVTSYGLAKCGFGDSLYKAAIEMERDDLLEYLVEWRQGLIEELRTNSRGYIGRKQPTLASSIPDTFPNVDTLMSYVNPITSASMGRDISTLKPSWSKELDISKLAAVCEFYFEWGYKEAILKRFRSLIWHSAALRILRRAAVDFDESGSLKTLSQLMSLYFSSDTADDTLLSNLESIDEPLIVKIHSSRNHSSTDGLLEYRLEIAPLQFARMASAGIEGLRMPEGPDEWASESDGEEDAVGKKPKAPPEPNTHLRIWVPACMMEIAQVQLVNEFQEKASRKRNAKNRPANAKNTAKVDVHPRHTPEALEQGRSLSPTRATLVTGILPASSTDTETGFNSNTEVPYIPSLVSSQTPSDIPKIRDGKSMIRDLTKSNSKLKKSGPGIKNHFPTTKHSSPIRNRNDLCATKSYSFSVTEETKVTNVQTTIHEMSQPPSPPSHSTLSLAPFPLSSDAQDSKNTILVNTVSRTGERLLSKQGKPQTSPDDSLVTSQSSQPVKHHARTPPERMMDVIEISSDSDCDSAGMAVNKLPPPLSRAKAKARLKEKGRVGYSKITPKPAIFEDIIDLT